MTAEASSRLAQWWLEGVNAVDRARPLVAHQAARAFELGASREAWSAAAAARALRWAQRWLRRLAVDDPPQTAAELLAYARSIERDLPGLAADLRCAALRHQASAD